MASRRPTPVRGEQQGTGRAEASPGHLLDVFLLLPSVTSPSRSRRATSPPVRDRSAPSPTVRARPTARATSTCRPLNTTQLSKSQSAMAAIRASMPHCSHSSAETRSSRKRPPLVAGSGSAAARPSVIIVARPSSSRSHGAAAPARLRGPTGRCGDLEQTAAGLGERTGDRGRNPGVEVGLPGEPDVERLERSGGLQQQDRCLCFRIGAHSICPRAARRGRAAGRPPRRPRPRPAGLARVERAGMHVGLGGGQGSVGSPLRVGGQADRTLQEGRRGRQPGAGLGAGPPSARARRRRPRPVRWPPRPGATPDVPDRSVASVASASAACAAQRSSAGRRRRRPTAPADGGSGRRQPISSSCAAAASSAASASDAQRLRSAPQQRRVPGGVRRRQQHQPLRRLGQRPHPPQVVLLGDRPETVAPAGDREAAGQLGLAHPSGQLEQRQRVAAGLGDEPVADLLVQLTGDGGGEQRSGVVRR